MHSQSMHNDTAYNTTAHGEPFNIRFLTYNVFYRGIRSRAKGIGRTIKDKNPDIAVFTELWKEKWDVLEQAKKQTGRDYKFCDNGPQEKTWDGDIMYDHALFHLIEDNVVFLGRKRGLSWALLEHRTSYSKLLVFGIHPLRPYHEKSHLRNIMKLERTRQKLQKKFGKVPSVVMGDFNAMPSWPSMKCMRGQTTEVHGVKCDMSAKFDDAFLEAGTGRSDTHSKGGSIDHIMIEKTSPKTFKAVHAAVYRHAPGRSDHYPLYADVLMTPPK